MQGLRDRRIAKRYSSVEDLAVATGLTVAEIEAAEQLEDDAPPQHVNGMRTFFAEEAA
jgi:hypothetical protein